MIRTMRRWIYPLRRKVLRSMQSVHIKSLKGLSVWDIWKFLSKALRRGKLRTRASSLAYHWFLALIPSLLVAVVLSSFVPGFDVEDDIIPFFSIIIPPNILEVLLQTLQEVEKSNVGGVLSLGFLSALWFSARGFLELFEVFDHSYLKFRKRSVPQRYGLAYGLVLANFFYVYIILYLLQWLRLFLKDLGADGGLLEEVASVLTLVLPTLGLFFFIYLELCTLYFLGLRRPDSLRFFSPGALLAAPMVLLIMGVYGFYMTSFSRYNEFYGSIGSLFLLLILLYFVAMAVIVGFEFNASVRSALTLRKTRKGGQS